MQRTYESFHVERICSRLGVLGVVAAAMAITTATTTLSSTTTTTRSSTRVHTQCWESSAYDERRSPVGGDGVQHFATTVRGGVWTAASKGVALHSYRAEARTQEAEAWSAVWGFAALASFALGRYGAEDALLVCEYWVGERCRTYSSSAKMKACILLFRMTSSLRSQRRSLSRSCAPEQSGGRAAHEELLNPSQGQRCRRLGTMGSWWKSSFPTLAKRDGQKCGQKFGPQLSEKCGQKMGPKKTLKKRRKISKKMTHVFGHSFLHGFRFFHSLFRCSFGRIFGVCCIIFGGCLG